MGLDRANQLDPVEQIAVLPMADQAIFRAEKVRNS
jgi:hypothetical protein